MKKPDNFSAGATVKKTDPLAAAISNNFSTVRQSTPEPVTQIVQPVQTPVVESVPAAASANTTAVEQEVPVTRKEPKEKFLVSMSKGERSQFKAFCATKNVSMNHFVMCAMDYFKEDLESGKVTISPHSYKRQD